VRMPTFAELDSDQRGIYTESPANRAVLVTGPPGTGKTVVAFHRALRLSKGGKPVTLLMFNNVLSKYADSVDIEHDITICNLHKWVDHWFRHAFKKRAPHKTRFDINWQAIGKTIRETTDISILHRLCWGHLIIDEGQDFPVSMYEAFMDLIDHPLLEEASRPTLTVFADENQTITENNSTLQEIRQTLDVGVRNKRYWRLFKNYRNTREISEFSTFYQLTGRSAAKAPDRGGMKPQVIMLPDHAAVAEHITNFVINNGQVEVGVLSFGKKGDVKNIYSELNKAKEEKKSKHTVQMYVNGPAKESIHHDAKYLKFGTPPSITVLHNKSSKGLEFDAVFIVNMHRDSRAFDASAQELIKDMYVVSSRARNTLFFDIVCFGDSLPQITRLLPSPESRLCGYTANTEWKSELREKLKHVPWSETEEMADQIRADTLADEILSLGDDAPLLLSSLIESSKKHMILKHGIKEYTSGLDKQNIVRLIKEIGCHRVEKDLMTTA